ncbi:amino acid ABC transporter permease [Taylorella equigenitalis]|uniref:Glutamate Aspartate transport system permease protein GltK n=3 Tax=Taylorella equigenitalis TaxID=29575 RepID=A0A654KH07_TAYEM|nr:amino acid ABC transporter permease [Taylorella equigenitalis]ADU91727.1 Glutamate Aspartate transport system permease protein GltK [Taylorella equigenitalis MCE9]AFN35295.1 putative amino acid ABC transporter permease protein [Taylorella equigenitalis ATCC 35865]ASY38728.1 amino acid ABC transporter permease [Taylorella equigenitalis]ASY40252.1 amino acid ABC transporter permease [Taylorella equigenitalis]ASY41686.1 amino acid ABC transporter permease [Taylorella equigenitalis]
MSLAMTSHSGPWYWLRKNLFASPAHIIATVLILWFLIFSIPLLVDWLFIDANFDATKAADCRDSAGACWSFVRHKYRMILFGLYPYFEQWRPFVVTLLLIAVLIYSALPRAWNRSLIFVWLVVLTICGILMYGGVFGLSHVETARWGGLPITLMLSIFGIMFATPLGIILALGRRSHMPLIRALSTSYIELVRGVPFVSLLFMASVMVPLFFPEGVTFNKLLRAQLAVIIYMSAYIAEVVRGGLQSIPKGQYEGAKSLGLSYWQYMRLIILPQALTVVIPPLVSIFISIFKDTSLVVIIGIYDLTLSAKVALSDPQWSGLGLEAYVFLAFIYFIFCFAMSKYSRYIEARLRTGHRH